MSRAWFALHVAAAVAALSLTMLAVSVGVGEGQPAGPAQTTTAPSQLTEQYPLGDRKLAQGGSAARSPRPAGASDDGGSLLWLLLLVPVAVLVVAVWLVAYARSGPPTAYGYALGNEPRRRRRVPPSLIKLLTPLFAYNHHRDAYVLRGIGNRRGPVLKMSQEGEEQWAVKPARAMPAAAPLGVRGEDRPAGGVREPAPTAEAKPRAAKAGKGKKPRAAPKTSKPKGPKPAPSLTDALTGERPAPTGRFKRDEARESRPAGKTRK